MKCVCGCLPLESLCGVPLTLSGLQSALHGRVAHLLLVARQQPAVADLSHQTSDEPADAQRVRVVRPAEVEGQALLVQPSVRALGRRGPQQLCADRRLPAAWSSHQQDPPGGARLCGAGSQGARIGGAPARRQRLLLLAGSAGHPIEVVGFLLEAMLDLVKDPLPAVKALPLQQTGLGHFDLVLLFHLFLLFIGVPSFCPSHFQLQESPAANLNIHLVG